MVESSAESPAAAFFPWFVVMSPQTYGDIRLLPYRRGALPGDLPGVRQVDIDTMLGTYEIRGRGVVDSATMLEVGKWHTGMNADLAVETLFKARTALAFSGLANRRLFRSFGNYCNFDSFQLIVQRYQPGKAGTFAFTTRRRDGITRHLWGSNKYAHVCPSHVDFHSRPELDEDLIRTVMRRDGEHGSLLEAVEEFNSANTDSDAMPVHIELVMVKSAFEWLFGIGQQANEFAQALTECLAEFPSVPGAKGPMLEKWRSATPKPQSTIVSWARDFCAVRGASAHGAQRKRVRFAWPAETHLAFAALLFPLAFKIVAAKAGLLKLKTFDRERAMRLEHYLAFDPGAHDQLSGADHPWSDIDVNCHFDSLVP